jgi:hypothetical protein
MTETGLLARRYGQSSSANLADVLERVHLVPYREIVAVVSPVPLAEFDETARGRTTRGSAPRWTAWRDGWSWG